MSPEFEIRTLENERRLLQDRINKAVRQLGLLMNDINFGGDRAGLSEQATAIRNELRGR